MMRQVLDGYASQNRVFDGSDVQVGGLRDREGCEVGRHRREVKVGLGVGEARTGSRRATSECVPRKR
jgi:hypothetical protein